MNDLELLKFAAKAAGYPIHSDAWACVAGGGTPSLYMGNHGPEWNPLTSDRDALRLAVKLRMEIGFEGDNVVFADGNFSEFLSEDPDAATRRAIVRAAAFIGESM